MAGWDDAGKDAATGAVAGAAFGPYGAAIGGVAGGLYGYFSGGDAQDAADQAMKNGQQYNYLGASPYKGAWNDLISQLRQQVNGAGPSLAQMQYQKANQDAMANQLALSRANRAPGAAYQAAGNMGQINQGMALGSAQLRLREQMAARQQLTGALMGAGGQDLARDQANQNAYLQILAAQLQRPSQFDQMAGIGSQAAMAYALTHRGSGSGSSGS